MTFFLLLVTLFALAHLPPLARLLRAETTRDRMRVAAGLGLLVPRTARLASWLLAALLVAIFPANIYGAISGTNAAGLPSEPWYTWSRLPFQALFIWWVLVSAPPRSPRPA